MAELVLDPHIQGTLKTPSFSVKVQVSSLSKKGVD